MTLFWARKLLFVAVSLLSQHGTRKAQEAFSVRQ